MSVSGDMRLSRDFLLGITLLASNQSSESRCAKRLGLGCTNETLEVTYLRKGYSGIYTPRVIPQSLQNRIISLYKIMLWDDRSRRYPEDLVS